MKKTIYAALTAICFLFTQQESLKADWNFNPKLKLNQSKDQSKERVQRDYNAALKMHKKIAGSVLGASIDFQVGYGSTNANIEEKTSKEITTESKSGFNVGAILNVNLFNILTFSSGLDFTKKNFGIKIPYTDPLQTGDSLVTELNNSYLNIPLNISLGTMISDKVGLYFTGGPYLGLLLNAENAVSGFKDFDFGLNGMVTGKYFLNPFVAILLGVETQYGGLNNLLSSTSVEKMQTVYWGGFTGVGIGF